VSGKRLLLTILIILITGCNEPPAPLPSAPALALAQQICVQQDTSPTETPLPLDVAAAIDPIVQTAMEKIPLAGMSLAIQCHSGPVYVQSYGYKDLATATPAQAATIYEVGSITKQFTAAAILQLAEQGKLRLDDPLTRFFPDFPAFGQQIQVQHLLNHTSGLAEVQHWHATLGVEIDTARAYTPTEIVALIEQLPLQFPPGSRQVYNNSGYYLLGAIIEQVSGLAYGEYLQQHIFDPLGLTSTSYCTLEMAGKAKGYRVIQGELQPAEFVHPSLYYAPGGICSTASDLVRWQNALATGRVVSPDSYRRMATPTALADGQQAPYGYGLVIGKNAGRNAIYHGGQSIGFTGLLIHYPVEGLTLAVLTNTLLPPDYTPETWASAITTTLFATRE
jgi:CubicO group peptidase (beta-lactamase class C family)